MRTVLQEDCVACSCLRVVEAERPPVANTSRKRREHTVGTHISRVAAGLRAPVSVSLIERWFVVKDDRFIVVYKLEDLNVGHAEENQNKTTASAAFRLFSG